MQACSRDISIKARDGEPFESQQRASEVKLNAEAVEPVARDRYGRWCSFVRRRFRLRSLRVTSQRRLEHAVYKMININKIHNLSSTTSNSLSKQILLHDVPLKQKNPHSFTASNVVPRIINTSHCSRPTLYWWSLVVHRQMYQSLEICSSEDLIYN